MEGADRKWSCIIEENTSFDVVNMYDPYSKPINLESSISISSATISENRDAYTLDSTTVHV